ncbi:hypothetical protein J3R83DRAFT_4378, partial [Lanmaoa asiatica]
TRSGGHLSEQVKPRVAEDYSDCREVVNGGGYDETRPKGIRNERDMEMNALCREIRPKNHRAEEGASTGVRGDWMCQSDGYGVHSDGRQGRKTGATRSMRHNSFRLK